jgi:hypothetical protein
LTDPSKKFYVNLSSNLSPNLFNNLFNKTIAILSTKPSAILSEIRVANLLA